MEVITRYDLRLTDVTHWAQTQHKSDSYSVDKATLRKLIEEGYPISVIEMACHRADDTLLQQRVL